MKIKEALDITPIEKLEAEILLAHVLKQNRSFLYTHPDKSISATEIEEYKNYLNKRQQGYPIAYLTGNKEFWSLPLQVNEHTLIPRPETELLVELILDIESTAKIKNILELGTGSGAISLALAKENPHWQITATDINLQTLATAEQNSKNLNINNIKFICSNWFKSIPETKFDIIVSNPPYLATKDPHLDQGDLRFEPINALIAGETGLESFSNIISQAKRFLKPDGLLMLEHGYNQQLKVRELLKQFAFKSIQSWQDYAGLPRVSSGRS